MSNDSFYRPGSAETRFESEEPEYVDCPHEGELTLLSDRGTFLCEFCGEEVERPELLEALKAELGKPYNLTVET